MQTFHHIKV